MINVKNAPNWNYRRRTVWASVLYSMGILAYLLFNGVGESGLHETMVTHLFLVIFLLTSGYVFGQVVDKSSKETVSQADTDNDLGTWAQRRILIFTILAFCMAGITWLAVRGEDSSLNATFASGLCLLYSGTLGGYLFGVTLDDSKFSGKKKDSSDYNGGNY